MIHSTQYTLLEGRWRQQTLKCHEGRGFSALPLASSGPLRTIFSTPVESAGCRLVSGYESEGADHIQPRGLAPECEPLTIDAPRTDAPDETTLLADSVSPSLPEQNAKNIGDLDVRDAVTTGTILLMDHLRALRQLRENVGDC